MTETTKKLKKPKKKHIIISAVAVVLVLALSLTAVFVFVGRETEYFITINGENITEEIYRAYLVRSVSQAQELFGLNVGEDGEIEPFDDERLAEFWGSEIEGAPVVDWIRENAKEQLVRDAVIRQLIAENDVTISDDEQERLSAYLDELWERTSEFYEKNDISREVFDGINESFIIEDLLFNWFSENNEIDAAETVSTTHFARYFIVNKFDANGSFFTETEIENLRETVREYIANLNDGGDIDEIHIAHLNALGVDADATRPLAVSAISGTSEAYLSRVPNFVEKLGEIEENTAFYAEDDNHFTVAIKLESDSDPAISVAHNESDARNALRRAFNEFLAEKIENADVIISQNRLNAVKVEELVL